MTGSIAARSKVGRKKKAVPSDYASVKIPRDVYVNAKVVSALTGREIAEVIGDAARAALAQQAEKEFNATKPARPPKR